LNKPKYEANLIAFNETLDDLYKNHGTESPLNRLFKVIETFALSILNNEKHNRLTPSSIDDLISIITNKTLQEPTFTENDRDALPGFSQTFKGWTNMCHKYRHGKADQQNLNVPVPLFNMIFSQGVSNFRFLLELDNKLKLTPK